MSTSFSLAAVLFGTLLMSSTSLAQSQIADPPKDDALQRALAVVKWAQAEQTKDGMVRWPDFSDVKSFDDLICRMNETSPDIAASLAASDPGRSSDIDQLDRSVTGFLQHTAFLPPDAGAAFLREKFDEHGCNWRGIVPGPEEVPAFATRDSLINDFSGLRLPSIENVEAIYNGHVPESTAEPPLPPVGGKEFADFLPASPGALSGEWKFGLVRAGKVNRICSKYGNIDHSPECVAYFQAESALQDGSFTILDYCAAATSGIDPTVAMSGFELAGVVVVVAGIAELGYKGLEIYHGENEGWNKLKRWDATRTIRESNETIVEANQRQEELRAGRDFEDLNDVSSSGMSDAEKQEYVHLELEKREAEVDKAAAEKTLEELREKKAETEPYEAGLDCTDPTVIASMQDGFDAYKRQIEGVSKQCRREISPEYVEVLPDVQPSEGNCDLKALRDDVQKAEDDLTNPDVMARLESKATEFRIERQQAWNNLSCSEACLNSGGECTLDNNNKQICVPVAEFYGTGFDTQVDKLISEGGNTGDEKPVSLDWENFGLDDTLAVAVESAKNPCPLGAVCL